MKGLSSPCRILSLRDTTLSVEENNDRIKDTIHNLKTLNIPYLLVSSQANGNQNTHEQMLIIPESHSNISDIIVNHYDLKTYIKYHHDSFCELVTIGSDKTYAMGYLLQKPKPSLEKNEFHFELDGVIYAFTK